MNTNHTNINEMKEVIGENNIVRGICWTDAPKFGFTDDSKMKIEVVGRETRFFEGRFQVCGNSIFFAAPRKRNFVQIAGEGCLSDLIRIEVSK